ncbi:serine/threonine-protein kinase [Pleionea litopenaei]|uniref:non-specific serine/threonine protein kinase n=1 Tax=Pleionea litopenaei TaxID=3070815 RepID=A0AA51RQI6_9GAMM|nr:serine/threonine-protein kinase [Pleionea sp. HL-JVS1]WMS85786.1 serine/threonine-protein kinase [Pleionea sp. HL-JVS1]
MQSKPINRNNLALFSSGWLALFIFSAAAVVLFDWQLQLFDGLYLRFTHHLAPELQQQSLIPISHYFELSILGTASGLLFFIFGLRLRLSLSLIVLLLTAIALTGTFIAYFSQTQQLTPFFETTIACCIGWACGLLERVHQAPLRQLMMHSQRWGEKAVQWHVKNQQWREAFELAQQLRPNNEVLELSYQIAQNCEQKRDFNRAKDIYLWLIKRNRHFKDCQQRLQQLESIRPTNPGLGGTVVMEQTLLMPTEGLQPPTLGRYRIESILGKGAMGVVYRGIDPAINREVAIKTLALSQENIDSEHQLARERFFREAETAGKLNHPNIVTVYDVGEEQDLAFIAMDLLTGVPLDKHIKKDQLLPVVLVYQLMTQIASALAYAHSQGVVHRDIKPANIIYDDDKHKVIITDFGIAHLVDKSKTRTGAILGSPFYMSPEQVQGKRIDGRSDIFSMGVTFYQLLTGQLPFKGESLATVALNITTQKHEPVRKIRADLPASASRIINKALQKDQDKRYQSVEELQDALVNALKRDFKTNPL